MILKQFSLEDLCDGLVVTEEMLETIKFTEGFKIVFLNKKTKTEYEYEIESSSRDFDKLLSYIQKVLLGNKKLVSKELKNRLKEV